MCNASTAHTLRPRALAVLAACWITLFAAAIAGAAGSAEQKPLTNEDIVTMVQAGLAPDVVIEKIRSSKSAFDTSTQALVALKQAGVSGDIIRYMVNPASTESLRADPQGLF